MPNTEFLNRQSFLGGSPSAWIRPFQNCVAMWGSTYQSISPSLQVLGLHHDTKALPNCVSSLINLPQCLSNKPLVHLFPSKCLFLRGPKLTRWYVWSAFSRSYLPAVKELPILNRMWDTYCPWHKVWLNS